MKIDGLKISTEKRDQSIVKRVSPEDSGSYRHLRLVVDDENRGKVEFLEGDASPGIEVSEIVTFNRANDEIIERLVRAMAGIHFKIDDEHTHFLDVDKSLIQRGFDVGSNSSGQPVWISTQTTGAVIISSNQEGGLPTHEANKAVMLYKTAQGREIKFTDTTVRDLIEFIDGGLLQQFSAYSVDLEVEGLYFDEPTLH